MSHGTQEPLNVGRFLASTLLVTFVGVVGLFAISLWTVVLMSIATATVWADPLSGARIQILSTLATGAGTVMTVAGYLAWSDRSLSFLDVERPSLRDGAWMVGGLVTLFVVLYAISSIFQAFGISTAEHAVGEAAKANPELLLPLIPLSVLAVGPGEELLYRNVVQKTLYDTAPRWVAILTASVVFALVHFSAYATGTTAEVLASLTIVLALSILLGIIYERTENIVVPAVVHGVYNAVTFVLLYVELTDGPLGIVGVLF